MGRKAQKSDSLKGSSQTEREVKNKMLELLNVKARSLDITNKPVFPPEAESNLDYRSKMEVSPAPAPSDQRRDSQRRKDQLKDHDCENVDLKFIETLEKPEETQDVAADKLSEEAREKSPVSSVVAVDIKQETQNLEDWLDDFLED